MNEQEQKQFDALKEKYPELGEISQADNGAREGDPETPDQGKEVDTNE